MWTYSVRTFQTSDSQWHLQISRECQTDIQVLKLYTVNRLIEALDLATQLQLHIDNIETLPLTQYILQAA
jgi:predicted restriction endonuclease